MLATGSVAIAQQKSREAWVSPFDFPLLLSANFGELRPNHFHNGIDIKTQGVTGKPVHCVAEGYISRVAVQHGGYGQVVYVAHPDGHTSVYGHVERFSDGVQKRVREYQYANETFVCSLTFTPDEFPVRQGEIIAWSGNEGASAGPHLHLEMRDTETGTYIDPMPFYRRMLEDHKAPVASLVGIYPLENEGVVEGSSRRKLVAVSGLKQPVTAWGKIYTGISAKDYMDGTSNFYGVHSVKLFVDDREVFHSLTDSVRADENRMINAFTDYDELMRSRRLIMRSYRAPGNRLQLLQTDSCRGVVTIDEERDYRFRYELEDNFGNRSSYRFTVRGKRQEIPQQEHPGKTLLRWDRTNVIQQPGMQLVIPQGMLYENAWLDKKVSGDSARTSFDYVLDAGHTPLHGFCELSIGVRHRTVADSTKYYILQRWGKGHTPIGGKMENGWVKARVRTFGTFAVGVDTVPPRITPLNKGNWRGNFSRIRLKISDAESGIASYKVHIDGKFVLFGLKKGALVIQDPRRISRSGVHRMEVWVTDCCGNEQYEKFQF